MWNLQRGSGMFRKLLDLPFVAVERASTLEYMNHNIRNQPHAAWAGTGVTERVQANGKRDNKANSEGHYRKNGLSGCLLSDAVCSSQVSKHLALKYRWDYGTEYA